METRLVASLQKGLEQLLGLISRVLSTQQRKAEFMPDEGTPPVFDRCTDACLAVTGLLEAVHQAAQVGRYGGGCSRVGARRAGWSLPAKCVRSSLLTMPLHWECWS